MASSDFVVQGITTATHAGVLRRVFEVPGLSSALVSVAFVSKGGVGLASSTFRPHAGKMTVFAGVRNGITTVQGMRALLELGTTLYAVDTGADRITFHPKVYLASGDAEARLVVGSANLTRGGLHANVEASLITGLALSDDGDRALVEQVSTTLTGMVAEYPENVTRISDASELDAMFADGKLIDEDVVRPRRQVKPGTDASPGSRAVPAMRLKTPALPPSASVTRPRPRVTAISEPESTAPLDPLASFELVWTSKPLTERDLNIPDASGTNPTGSMGLKKGLLEGIDFQRYFRDEVLSYLAWEPHDTPGKEQAVGDFYLSTSGQPRGLFNLIVTHDNRTNTVMFRQRQFMTTLHWGSAVRSIQDPALLGRTLRLYRDMARPTRFLMDID